MLKLTLVESCLFVPFYMKKFFALALLSGLAGTAHAQAIIKAGTVQLGGNVGYSHTSVESPVNNGSYNASKQTTIYNQFTIAPSVGFFVADNLAVGISGGYQISQNKYKQPQGAPTYDEKTKQFRFGAFVQYYKMFSEQFGISGTLGGGYQLDEQPYNYGSNEISTKGGYANLTPSIVFFPVSKLAIGASIGGINYLYANYKTPATAVGASDSYTSSNFAANFGLSQLLFSGTFYFGR
jgi:hypothetical protein